MAAGERGWKIFKNAVAQHARELAMMRPVVSATSAMGSVAASRWERAEQLVRGHTAIWAAAEAWLARQAKPKDGKATCARVDPPAGGSARANRKRRTGSS
eukprot:7357789-Prymnesium_polylepis.1